MVIGCNFGFLYRSHAEHWNAGVDASVLLRACPHARLCVTLERHSLHSRAERSSLYTSLGYQLKAGHF
jgi:hypothetical protein